MSQGPQYLNEVDALLSQSIKRLEKDYDNATGDWGHLSNEPCRFCHEIGGVYFRIDDSPCGKNEPQCVRCDKCGRTWEADSTAA